MYWLSGVTGGSYYGHTSSIHIWQLLWRTEKKIRIECRTRTIMILLIWTYPQVTRRMENVCLLHIMRQVGCIHGHLKALCVWSEIDKICQRWVPPIFLVRLTRGLMWVINDTNQTVSVIISMNLWSIQRRQVKCEAGVGGFVCNSLPDIGNLSISN